MLHLAQVPLVQPLVPEGASKLTEYGFVGILVLVIICVMGMLLKFILDQVRDDRKVWALQAEKFSSVLEKIGLTMQTMVAKIESIDEGQRERSGEVARLTEKIQGWREGK